MLTARDIMTPNAECIGEHDSLTEAAQKLRDLGVGSMPICGEDNRLKGMLTDRDIVVSCVAAGRDPAKTPAGDFGGEKPVTIGADDSIDEAIKTMQEHQSAGCPSPMGTNLSGWWHKPISPAQSPKTRSVSW